MVDIMSGNIYNIYPEYIEEDNVCRHYLNGMVAMNEKAYEKLRKKAPAGHWIGEGDGYADGKLVLDTWYCSNCDFMVEGDEFPIGFNYCPNCGADMRGGNE